VAASFALIGYGRPVIEPPVMMTPLAFWNAIVPSMPYCTNSSFRTRLK
jgi:hypothetical protein